MRPFLIALVFALVGGSALALDEAAALSVRGAIEGQIAAFRRDDATGAYAQASPMIQQMFPSPDGFMAMVRQSYRPVYRPGSYVFGDSQETPDGVAQSVRIVDAEGVAWEAAYTLQRQPDGSWKISGCTLVKLPGDSV